MFLFAITLCWFYRGIILAKITDGPGRAKILTSVATFNTANWFYHNDHSILVLKHAMRAFSQTGPAGRAGFIIKYRIPVL